MATVVATRSFEVGSSPRALWPLLTDTDRFNRLLGSTPIVLQALPRSDSGARFLVKTRSAGFALEYEELPFEWTQGRAFSVLRKMRGGPVSSYRMSWQLEPKDTGATVSARLEIQPRSWPFALVARVQAERIMDRAERLVADLDASIVDGTPSPYRAPVGPVNEPRLRLGLEALVKAGVAPKLAEEIGTLLRTAADADLVRLRPFEFADRVVLPRLAVLRAMLHGVVNGIFELRWSLICPSCLGPSEQFHSLLELGEHGFCQLCDLSFDLDLDRAVEATFFPHAAVRSSSDQLFCTGGPSRMPHVIEQAMCDPNQPRTLVAPNEPGRYRLFARGGGQASVEIDPDGEERAEFAIETTGVRPAMLRLKPGGPIEVVNRTDEPRHVKLERLSFASVAATAHTVSTLPEFRALFSSEILKRSTPLKVSSVAILFSDLTGSTALYSRLGDAVAFRFVDDHFDVVRAAVAEHQGVMVKTMGDAVMAAFTDTEHCFRAAIEALERFEDFRSKHPEVEAIGLKLGFHAGPCYVVTANGQLDYFGQSVNVASRVQHLAASGELVFSAEHLAALPPELRERVRFSEPFEAQVKGVAGALRLLRLSCREP